jgi:hypothetical protein
MGAKIVDMARGVLTIRITGKLVQSELAAVQRKAGEVLRQEGPMSILILTEDFQGWAGGGEEWGDLSFQDEHDRYIGKLAIVGEGKWEDLALMFVSKGLRKFPIEYFQPAELAKARAWLAASNGS